MGTGLIIAAYVVTGLIVLFTLMGLISSRIRKQLDRIVQETFSPNEVVGATTRANFFGIQSKGGAQARGNGALVLTREALHFIRAVPRKDFKIPLSSIQRVTTPRAFNGRSVMVQLLCVNYTSSEGEDAMAWALKDVPKWVDAIEKLSVEKQ